MLVLMRRSLRPLFLRACQGEEQVETEERGFVDPLVDPKL